MADNRQKTGKGRGGKRSTSWKPGQSGNPKGAPQRGGSLKEIFDYYDQLTAEEIAEQLPPGELRSFYLKLPKGIAMKHLKVIRVNAAIIAEPTPGLLNLVQDRTDGKVPDQVNHTGTLKVPGLQEALKTIYGNRSTTD